MTDRMTKANVETRARSLNDRMEKRGSIIRYQPEYRNGWCCLDAYYVSGGCQRNVTCGTKAEVGTFLHAMMVALDDALFRG